MTDDLRTTLTDLARAGADEQRDRLRQHRGLDAAAITLRAGRARHRRTATTAGISIAAVTGLLLAGAALVDRPDPQPAVTPSPTATTTPSPSPSASATPAVVLPTGDPSLPFGTCGSFADAAPAAPLSDVATVQTRVDEVAVAAGERVPVSASIWSTGGAVALAEPTDGVRYAVLADGVVVGTADQHATTTGTWSILDDLGGPRTHGDRIGLTVCAAPDQPAVTAGAPLPAGTYTLLPWAEVASLSDGDAARAADQAGTFDDLVGSDGTLVTITGSGTTLTVTGSAEAVEVRPGDSRPVQEPAVVTEPQCGAPAPTPTPAGDLTLTFDAATTTADLRYTGPGRARAVAYVYFSQWAVQDGVVVGGSWTETDGDVAVDLADGPGHVFSDTAELTACPAYGTVPLPAGEYQVYAGVVLTVSDRVLPDGSIEPSGTSTWVISEPVTRTIG
jgi:hypothetical protein